jgi:hypothetical protein
MGKFSFCVVWIKIHNVLESSSIAVLC